MIQEKQDTGTFCICQQQTNIAKQKLSLKKNDHFINYLTTSYINSHAIIHHQFSKF